MGWLAAGPALGGVQAWSGGVPTHLFLLILFQRPVPSNSTRTRSWVDLSKNGRNQAGKDSAADPEKRQAQVKDDGRSRIHPGLVSCQEDSLNNGEISVTLHLVSCFTKTGFIRIPALSGQSDAFFLLFISCAKSSKAQVLLGQIKDTLGVRLHHQPRSFLLTLS
ncbi:hypothetical protein AOLI_G00030940 [Acnodon oligacanthus]